MGWQVTIGLGFYALHPAIMDALYEADNLDDAFREHVAAERLPNELIEVVENHRVVLSKILDRTVKDLSDLNSKAEEKIQKRIGEGFERLRTKKDEWDGKIRLRPVDKRNTRARTLEVGWYWETKSNCLFINPYIWVDAGRKAEEMLARFFAKKGIHGRTGKNANVGAGNLIFATIDVTGYVLRDTFELPLNDVCDAIGKQFSWINSKALTSLFEESKSL